MKKHTIISLFITFLVMSISVSAANTADPHCYNADVSVELQEGEEAHFNGGQLRVQLYDVKPMRSFNNHNAGTGLLTLTITALTQQSDIITIDTVRTKLEVPNERRLRQSGMEAVRVQACHISGEKTAILGISGLDRVKSIDLSASDQHHPLVVDKTTRAARDRDTVILVGKEGHVPLSAREGFDGNVVDCQTNNCQSKEVKKTSKAPEREEKGEFFNLQPYTYQDSAYRSNVYERDRSGGRSPGVLVVGPTPYSDLSRFH